MKSEIASKRTAQRYTQEDHQYWDKQQRALSHSGKSRRDYCRAQGVDYHRFGYWLSQQKKRVPGLIAVQVKKAEPLLSQRVLAKVSGSKGQSIELYDVEALCALVSRLH